MSLFRRADAPTARETFLVAALASVGVTADDIKAAQDANDTKFLTALTDRPEDPAVAKLSALESRLKAAGFTPEQLATDAAFAAEINKRIDTKAAAKAADLLAARGIAPVAQPAAEGNSGSKQMTRAEFEAMPHEKRNAYIRSGGKVTA